MSAQQNSSLQQAGLKTRIRALDTRYGVFSVVRFGIAAGIGFLIAEAITALGLFELYGRFTAPNDAYSSPGFLSIDVAALALGVAVSFFLNERITVDFDRTMNVGALHSLPARLLKFEGVNALGNLTLLMVQFILFWTLSLTPVVGNLVGAVVSYPVTYLVSMRFVWRRASREGPSQGNPGQHPLRRLSEPASSC